MFEWINGLSRVKSVRLGTNNALNGIISTPIIELSTNTLLAYPATSCKIIR